MNNASASQDRVVLSKEARRFFSECALELARAYNSAIKAGHEYEAGYQAAMDILGVPLDRRDWMFAKIKWGAEELGGPPYDKLSPVNQYLVALPSYVEFKTQGIPDKLERELDGFFATDEWYRFIVKEFGVPASQRVKGALWRPGAGCAGSMIALLATLVLSAVLVVICLIAR